jgi:hypothetical protein
MWAARRVLVVACLLVAVGRHGAGAAFGARQGARGTLQDFSGQPQAVEENHRQMADSLCGTERDNDAPRPRIAVCVTGSARTLWAPRVYRSMFTNAISALGANTSVFMDLKLAAPGTAQTAKDNVDEPGKGHVHVTKAMLQPALDLLRPERVQFDSPASSLPAEGLPAGCTVSGFAADHLAGLMGQWLGTASCFKMVEEHEAKQGARFDWVMRLRTDDVWFSSLPPWCALQPGEAVFEIALNPGDKPRPQARGGVDWWFILPRASAPVVFNLAKEVSTTVVQGLVRFL